MTLPRFPSWLFPAVALPLCVLLLQWHGIPFWQELTGSRGWGALASPALEWLGLWAWHEQARAQAATVREGALFVAAGLITALLVAGPLYQVGKPLLVELRQSQALGRIIERTEGSLEVVKDASRQENRKVGQQIVSLTMEANDADRELAGADLSKRRALPGMEKVLIGAHLALLIVLAVGTVAAVRVLGQQEFTRRREDAKEEENAYQEQAALHRVQPMVSAEEINEETARPEPFRDDFRPSESLEAQAGNSGNGNESIISKVSENGAGGWADSPGAVVSDDSAGDNGNFPGARPEPMGRIIAQPDELHVRVHLVLRTLDERYPGLSDAQRGEKLPAGAKDISFLRNHDARVAARRKALASGDKLAIDRARVITDGQLMRIEAALGLRNAELNVPRRMVAPSLMGPLEQ